MDFTFRNTLSPLQWGLIAATALGVFALYFLKLRRAPLEVPSTLLWKRAIDDLRVNSLWQRLRQSLLLWLQLLLLALAALALLRPGWKGSDVQGQRLIFLVDNSASMGASDAPANAQRLAAAKETVGNLIDQMDRGATGMIISFADQPRVVQEFTANTRLLRERLETITLTSRTTDLLGALKLADSLANPAQVAIEEGGVETPVVTPEPATLYLLTDGKFADVKDFSLGNLYPIHIPMGSLATNNLAILALSVRRSETNPASQQAFVQVANFSDEPRQIDVELTLDGIFLDARGAKVGAQEATGMTFALGEAAGGKLEARIATDSLTAAGDKLAIDNVAYAGINDIEPGKVLVVTPGNIALETALATDRTKRYGEITFQPPRILEEPEYQQAAATGAYDLVIFDRCTPKESPRANTVYIGELPPGPTWRDGENPAPKISVPQILDWNRAHPLLANIELGNFDIVDSLALPLPPGGVPLIDSADGPIAAVAPREGYEDVVLGFPILVAIDGKLQRNTDWINRHSFPTFWLNVLDYFVGERSEALRAGGQPGQSLAIKPVTNLREIEVALPTGRTTKLSRQGDEPFQLHDTDTPGVYTVSEAGTTTQRLAVNLFSRDESDIRPRTPTAAEGEAPTAITIGATAVGQAAPARQELWRPLLLAALVVLVVEWYIYNRRVYL